MWSFEERKVWRLLILISGGGGRDIFRNKEGNVLFIQLDHRRMNGLDFRDLFFYLLNKDYIQ